MTQHEYDLQILEFDKALNAKCEPIRKQLGEVGNQLDQARINKEQVSLTMNLSKARVTELQTSLCELNEKWQALKEKAEALIDKSDKTLHEVEIERAEYNKKCEDVRHRIVSELNIEQKSLYATRMAYNEEKIRIAKLLCAYNAKLLELRTAQREEWNRKHEWIVTHKSDVE